MSFHPVTCACTSYWALNTGSAYDYLKRLTDLHRVHLFDVVMQYRAIFADDSSVGGSMRSGTRPTVNLLLRLRASLCATTPKVPGQQALERHRTSISSSARLYEHSP